MNRSAIPERAFLKTATAGAGGAAVEPWPLKRAAPESFVKGADLVPESDRVAYRAALTRLAAPDARFERNGATWKVETLTLIP